MKRTILLTGVLLLFFGLTTASYAAHYGKSLGASYKAIEGTVLSVNQAKSNFVIQDKDDGTRTTVYASSKQIVSLNSGDSVKVTLSIPGNRARKIVR
jgi:hypothetical protein